MLWHYRRVHRVCVCALTHFLLFFSRMRVRTSFTVTMEFALQKPSIFLRHCNPQLRQMHVTYVTYTCSMFPPYSNTFRHTRRRYYHSRSFTNIRSAAFLTFLLLTAFNDSCTNKTNKKTCSLPCIEMSNGVSKYPFDGRWWKTAKQTFAEVLLVTFSLSCITSRNTHVCNGLFCVMMTLN